MDPSKIELAWAAGFFDGEGSISLQRTRVGRYPRMSIPQSSDDGVPEVLTRFHRAVGLGGSIRGYPARKDNLERKPTYLLQITGKESVRVMNLLWPYLGSVKKAQALKVFSGVRAGYPCVVG